MSIETVGGIQGEFTQNSRGIQAEFKENSGRIPVDGSKMVRRWLEDGPSTSSGTSKMEGLTGAQYDGFVLPVRRVRTASTSGANCQYVGFVLRSFRYVACLILMMVVGVGEMWGQTDYSGVYYIANAIWNGNNTSSPYYWYSADTPEYNWYLVPAGNPQRNNKEDAYYSSNYNSSNGDQDKPFLTTFRTNRDYNSIWIVKKTGNLYYIIHALSGKYVKYEPPYINGVSGQTNNDNCHRKAIHLEAWTDPNNDPGNIFKYEITSKTNSEKNITGFNIRYTGTLTAGSNRHFNPAGDNWEYYYATNDKTPWSRGMVGLWTNGSDGSITKGSLWPHEDAKAALTPTINVNAENGTFTISTPTGTYLGTDGTTVNNIQAGFLPPGCSIKYTTGDGTQDAPTATTGNDYDASNPPAITNFTNVKAVVVGYGMVLSQVASTTVKCTPPDISYDNVSTVTITPTTEGSTIYYTTDANGTPSTLYESPISVTGGETIKAIARKSGCLDSEVITYTVRQKCATPTISITYNNNGTATVSITNNDTNGASVYYTTDGSVPTSGSSPYSASFNVTSGMTVKAVAVNTGYNNSNPAEETVVQVATPVIAIVNNEITITCGTEGATIYYKVDDGDFTVYSDALGISDNVSGHTITAYATKSSMVKSANAVATASETKLTLPTPTIQVLASPNGENKNVIFSISPAIAGVTYKYTLDGTDPSESNGTVCSGSFTLAAPAKVKVIAIHSNYVTSNVASSTSYVIPTNLPLLIQSQNNAWNGTDFHFYMIPGDVDNNNVTRVNTTSLFRPSMEWHFESAGVEDGVQFYYIVNNSAKDNENNPYYLCWDGTNVCMLIYDSSDAYKFKFKIVESATAGSFNIIPYAQRNASGNTNRFVNKDTHNANANPINLANNGNTNNTRWKFVASSALDKTVPFTVSNATNGTVYYKLSTEATSTAYVTPATTPTGYVTTSTAPSASTHQDWYIEQVNTTTTDDDWLTYYYIRNATTNEYLYYNESANNQNAFEMRSRIEGDADCYQFAMARAATQDRWFIVPKKKIGTTLNNIWTIYRDNNNALKLQATRNNTSTMWQFTNSTLTLAPPIIEFDPNDGKFKLSCSTDNVTYRYTTGDGTQADPTADSGTEYTADGIEPGAFTEIKAVAIKNSTASDVTTYHAAVLPTSTSVDRPYRIQNADCSYFYLQPRETGNVKTNTSSLARPNSAWRFEDAGHRGGTQLYRIYVKESETNNSYLYYNSSTNVCMKSQTEYEANTNDFGFLFYLRPYYEGGTTLDGYYVIPSNDATVRSISKNTSSGNNNEGDIFAQNISSADYKMARWNFIPQADWGLPETIPTSVLQVSDDNATYYYKIRNYNDTGYYIIPPTGTTGNAAYVSTSNATTDNNNMAWVFRIADQDAWLNYYHIRNALTGEYLYFNGDPTVTNNNTAFITKDKPAASASDTEKDRYQFIIAKTTDTANDGTGPYYYIVPKPLKDLAQQSFNSLYRDGGNPLKTKADRSNNKIKWTFEFIETLFCMPPKIMLDEEGHIDIVATTNASTVYYKQDDATDYSTYSSLLQMSEGSKTTITAKAILYPGQEPEYPSSEIEKIVIYQPTITLSQESYSYDGLAHTPTVSRVMLGEEDITDKCIVTYENNVTPGTATVIISSNDDDYVIYGSTTFTIESVGLIVAVDNITKEYGDADPVLTYTPTGLGVGDELTVNIERETGEGIGSYGISFVKVGTTDNVDYTLQRSGQDVSGDYSSITFKDGILYIVPKNIGDGIVPAEGISINLTKEGTATEYSPTLTHLKAGDTNPTSLVLNTDFTVGEPTVVRDDKIWTAKGKGHYTNAAQVAYITPPFIQNQGVTPDEYIAGYMATIDWTPITTGTNTWILTSVNPSVNIVTAVPVDYLPKDVPVLLTAASNLERIIVSPKSHAVASISSADRNRNLLKRVPSGGLTVQPAQVYVFYNKADVGTGEFVLTLGGTLSEGCYYIENPNYSPTGTTSGAPRRLKIQWGEATGIDNAECTMHNAQSDAWYTIDGRKFNGKPQERGLYINGGKKMMVK